MNSAALRILADDDERENENENESASEAPRTVSMALTDGATITIDGATAEIRDPEGRVLVRYRDGAAEISVAGDLILAAGGRVVVRSPQALVVETPTINVSADSARIALSGSATFTAKHVATTAASITQTAERYELSTIRLVERARDAFRDVADLAQTRVGRVRMLVRDAYSLKAERTSIVSEKETSIDGRRVLLG